MNDLTHPECPSELGERIASLNAVLRQLSEDAEWLRDEARRLRTQHASVSVGHGSLARISEHGSDEIGRMGAVMPTPAPVSMLYARGVRAI